MPQLAPLGRKCEEEGCETILSRYNRKRVCFAHQYLRVPRNSGLELRAGRKRRITDEVQA